MSVHQKFIKTLTAMPAWQAYVGATAAMSAGSFVCCMIYNSMYYGQTPGTWRSTLWGEATQSYLKFQGADPISYPEVRKK